jgi:hypothetical protein
MSRYEDYAAILEGDEEPLDPLGRNAVIAFGHIVDGCATAEDVANYRAWIVSLRLDGLSESDLATSINLADAVAEGLGLA